MTFHFEQIIYASGKGEEKAERGTKGSAANMISTFSISNTEREYSTNRVDVLCVSRQRMQIGKRKAESVKGITTEIVI
jgi:hypothetical protein